MLVTVDAPRTENEAADPRGTSFFTMGQVCTLPSGSKDARSTEGSCTALDVCVGRANAELPTPLLPPLHPASSATIAPALSPWLRHVEIRILVCFLRAVSGLEPAKL